VLLLSFSDATEFCAATNQDIFKPQWIEVLHRLVVIGGIGDTA